MAAGQLSEIFGDWRCDDVDDQSISPDQDWEYHASELKKLQQIPVPKQKKVQVYHIPQVLPSASRVVTSPTGKQFKTLERGKPISTKPAKPKYNSVNVQ